MIKIKFPHFHLKNPAPVLGVILRWGLLALFLAINLLGNAQKDTPEVLGAQTQLHREQLAYWQEVARLAPDYKDAFLMVAVRAWELGEDDLAKAASERALELDPNDETAGVILSSVPVLPPAP